MQFRTHLAWIIPLLMLVAILIGWRTATKHADGPPAGRDSGSPGLDTIAQQTLSCSIPPQFQQDAIWRPGQGRDELAVLITSAEAGDSQAAWNLFEAIQFCFGVPDSDRELRRELSRRAQADLPNNSVAEHQKYVSDKAAEVFQQYEERLRSMYKKCMDVPRTAGTAYDWLQQAAVEGHAEARIEFYQQGLRYVGDSQADRAQHVEAAKKFLRQSLAAGDARALPRLGQILRHEPAISGRNVMPDLVDVYALFNAAKLYANHHDSLDDWQPAWAGFLDTAENILSPEQIEQGRQRSIEYLEAVGCRPKQ